MYDYDDEDEYEYEYDEYISFISEIEEAEIFFYKGKLGE